MPYLELLIMLVGAHFVCDFVLQTDSIATGKNRRLDPAKYGVDWYYWMTAHAATHGFGVGLITGNVWLGFLEFCLHWLIDAGKCQKLYGVHTDQILHFACKLIIVGCVYFFGGF